MKSLLSFLGGKKAYIGAVGLALVALFQYLNGDMMIASTTLSQAISLAGLRHELQKTTSA